LGQRRRIEVNVYGDAFRHELLEYSEGAEGFVRRTLPYISNALAADRPVMVAVADEKTALLQEALAEEAPRVRFVEMHTVGRNPGRIISAWIEFLETRAPSGTHALGVGEPVWPGRSAAELGECHRHESLLNRAFDGGDAWHLLCPYDVDGLDDQVIEAAQHSHPFVAGRHVHGSDADDAPRPTEHPRPFDGALPAPLGAVRELAFSREDLAGLRHTLAKWSEGELLGEDASKDLVLAVNELTTNSVLYGGGNGRLLLWREQDTLLCEVRDGGYIEDPLTGRSRPGPEQHSGRGLWLVNHLCDLVQIRSSPSGTAIRVHKHRSTET
jgi:anti-sigma regulatory factor (Ser/Thr protein kinase)